VESLLCVYSKARLIFQTNQLRATQEASGAEKLCSQYSQQYIKGAQRKLWAPKLENGRVVFCERLITTEVSDLNKAHIVSLKHI
jgi:hypothetical protein